MRQAIVLATLFAALAVAGCHNHPAPAPPAPPPAAPPVPPPAPAPEKGEVAQQVDDYTRLKSMAADEIERLGLLGDVHFDYNKSDLREGDRAVLGKNADVLKKFDFLKITVEGHCDERGSVEYNLALGDKRAKASYDYLVSLGVPAERMKTVSYGKEFPLCQQSSEDCWGRNRRDHFAVSGKGTPAH
jgi:peptidoglycan-associated lipoprotein